MQEQREIEDGTGSSRNGTEPQDASLAATEAALEIRKQQRSLPGTVSDPEKIQVRKALIDVIMKSCQDIHILLRLQPAAACSVAQVKCSRTASVALLRLA